MEEAKRRKLGDRPINFNNIDDIVVLDFQGSDASDNEMNVPSNDEVQATEDITENFIEEDELKMLLTTWGVPSLLDNLISCGFNYDRLELLEESDYHLLIMNDFSKFGDFVEFRKFHRNWKVERESLSKGRCNDVAYILENGGKEGDEIRDFYKKNDFLIDPLREKLVDLILKEKRQIPRGILSQIAEQICRIFPTEKKNVYYEKLKNKQPTGLLYRKYKDSRETNKKKRQSPSEKMKAADEVQAKELDALLTDEVKQSIDFLKDEENYGENLDTQLVVQHWNTTFHYRNARAYKTFAEILDCWLPLRRDDGPTFIHHDFISKYGNDKAMSLLSKWEQFIFHNQNEILKGVRDAKQKKTFLDAQCGKDVNEKDKAAMMALHNLSYTVPAVTSKSSVIWTPSIPQSKDSMIIEVNNSAEIPKRLKFQYNLCELKNFRKHPVIFIIKNPKEPSSHVIAFEDIRYTCESLISAVDDAFKIYVMMKVPFPPQCVRVWMFINELFYKVALEEKPNAKIISMLDSFRI